MDLTQIRYFLALAETLNFTSAAEVCHVTQPALTKSIQKLEAELGGKLLLRERGNSQLTDLGRTMAPLLRRTFDAATAAREGAAQFHKQDVARLRIGIGAWVPPGSLRPLLASLSPRFPTLELSIRQGDTPTLNQWLLAAEIDVALTVDGEGLTERANSWPLFDDDVVAVVPLGHSLAVEGPLAQTELGGRDLVGRADAGVDPVLAPRGFRHTVPTHEHLWPLIEAGLGVALSTSRRTAPPGMLRRTLEPPHRFQVRVAVMPGRPATRQADALIKLARARAWERQESEPATAQ